MSETTGFSTGAPLLSPEFQDMVDRCVELFKLDVVQGLAFAQEPSLAAARGVNGNPSKLGSIVAKRMAQLKTGGKRGRTADSSKIETALATLYDANVRSLARRYAVDVTAAKPVFEQIDKAREFKFIERELTSETRLRSLHENLFDTQAELKADEADDPDITLKRIAPSLSLDPTIMRMIADNIRPAATTIKPGIIGAIKPPFGSIVVNKGLEFRIHKVKCVDETNPEWPGDDEIAMGAVAVADNGTSSKINEFMVRDDFDDGESKVYNPPRLLKTFSLTNVSYPADFMMVLALAEKDNGGMSDFLKDLWEAIKDDVQAIIAAVSAAAGAAIGTAIGGTLGTALGGPLGAIIGAVAGAIIGAIVGWIISALKDDIFTPQAAAVHLPNTLSTFAGGSLTSPQFTVNFRDHGGHYRVYYSWKINR